MSEADLIRQAKAGDRAAYDMLIAPQREAIYRLAYLILGDPHDADDVTQETLLRAFSRLSGFDPSYPLRPWLLRITANLARNRRRSLARYWNALTRFAATEPPAPALSAADQMQQQAQAVRLWHIVHRLRPAEQELVYMRYFLELTVEETAAALNVPPGTVKSRSHRVLAKLRGLIRQLDPELIP